MLIDLSLDLDVPWYFGEITRENTNEILFDQPVGTYLVRDSTTQSGYALAVKEANKVERYLISYLATENKFKFGDVLYDSIEDLIKFHSSTVSGCQLVQPAPKPIYLGLYDFKSQVDTDLSFTRGTVLNFIRRKCEWILCRSSDDRIGWVPSNYLTLHTSEDAAKLSGQSDQRDLAYCQMHKFIQLPIPAKVIRSRNPSLFTSGHLKIEHGDDVEIRKIYPNGFCYVRHKRDEIGGLVPLNYLEM